MYSIFAQGQIVGGSENFTSFPNDRVEITQQLIDLTPAELFDHPEFGTKPYRTACDDCVELLNRRTSNSRYYIEPDDSTHFYAMQSYSTIHYQENGRWITIDPRLKPTSTAGVYTTAGQRVQKRFDTNTGASEMVFQDASFKMNENLSLYFTDGQGNETCIPKADSDYLTVGSAGALHRNKWNNIDLQVIYKENAVKTNIILNEKPDIPNTAKWFVLEDIIEMPGGARLELGDGEMTFSGGFQGELAIVNEHGERAIIYAEPIAFDNNGNSYSASYSFIKLEDGRYAIRTKFSVDHLQDIGTTYPVTLDPLVYERDSIGFFSFTVPGSGMPVQSNADLKYTQFTLGSCDYTVVVNVPAESTPLRTLIDLEFNNPSTACRNGNATCERTDIRVQVEGPCGSTPFLACQPATVAPFVGTCTTDPNKVPGASAIPFSGIADCLTPQCPLNPVTFTLKNQSLQCMETCDNNCAVGRFWAITQEGRTLEGFTTLDNITTIAVDDDTTCAAGPVRLTAFPSFGVPPYSYEWFPTGNTDSSFLVFPETNTTYKCIIYDQCDSVLSAQVNVIVVPTPPAVTGDSTAICVDETLELGGNPTSTPGATLTWTAVAPANVGQLSSTTDPNPTFTPPVGVTGSFSFQLEARDSNCVRINTIEIQVVNPPNPAIVSSDSTFCAGTAVTLSVPQSYTDYLWPDGSTDSTFVVMQGGSYQATVTDGACEGVTGNLTLTEIPPFEVDALPNDTSIEQGNSVRLYTSVPLTSSRVDSFAWAPFDSLTCTDCPNPITTPQVTQSYTLYVETPEGCITIDSALVQVVLPDAYFIYSAFSPNGDGMNDEFWLFSASGVEVLEFQVYNRWGERVHEGATPWDGNYDGVPMPLETYTFYFRLALPGDKEVVEKGTVVLLR